MFKQRALCISFLVGVRVRMFLSISFNNSQFIVVIRTFNSLFFFGFDLFAELQNFAGKFSFTF